MSSEALRKVIELLNPVGYFEESRLKQFAKWYRALEINLGMLGRISHPSLNCFVKILIRSTDFDLIDSKHDIGNPVTPINAIKHSKELTEPTNNYWATTKKFARSTHCQCLVEYILIALFAHHFIDVCVSQSDLCAADSSRH